MRIGSKHEYMPFVINSRFEGVGYVAGGIAALTNKQGKESDVFLITVDDYYIALTVEEFEAIKARCESLLLEIKVPSNSNREN